MTGLRQQLAAHPLAAKKPYNAIKFARVDGQGTPLYTVAGDKKEVGAFEALGAAFEMLGCHCFHCQKWMKAQPLSHDCTRDHIRPRKDGGGDYLHNLVIACGPCNRAKGGSDLITFHTERGAAYLKALDEHIVRCFRTLDKT